MTAVGGAAQRGRCSRSQMLTLLQRRPAGQPRDYRLPQVEKEVGTGGAEIYRAPRGGAVERKPTPPD